jgi:hypothetical protein
MYLPLFVSIFTSSAFDINISVDPLSTLDSKQNCIVGVMVSVLTSNEVDCWFNPQSGQTKDY